MINEANDLVGYSLIECRFSKVSIRLVFAKVEDGLEQKYYLDTDNAIHSRGEEGDPSNESTLKSVHSCYEALEGTVLNVETGGLDRITIDFSTGARIEIVRNGLSDDNLLIIRNTVTPEWLAVG